MRPVRQVAGLTLTLLLTLTMTLTPTLTPTLTLTRCDKWRVLKGRAAAHHMHHHMVHLLRL